MATATGTNRAIVGQMASLRNEVGAIGKNQKNAHQGWKYRGIDDVLNVIGAALDRAEIVLTCDHKLLAFEPNEGGKGFSAAVEVIGTFTSTKDGSCITQKYLGQGTDPGDKAISKATSMAFKYLLLQGLQIPLLGACDDPDAESVFATPRKKGKPE